MVNPDLVVDHFRPDTLLRIIPQLFFFFFLVFSWVSFPRNVWYSGSEDSPNRGSGAEYNDAVENFETCGSSLDSGIELDMDSKKVSERTKNTGLGEKPEKLPPFTEFIG